jgi:hypothetical protein
MLAYGQPKNLLACPGGLPAEIWPPGRQVGVEFPVADVAERETVAGLDGLDEELLNGGRGALPAVADHIMATARRAVVSSAGSRMAVPLIAARWRARSSTSAAGIGSSFIAPIVRSGARPCLPHGAERPRGTSRRLPGPVVEDSPGCNLRPDPVAEATDAASLIRALNDFRAWAGDVSYRDMERGCNRLRSSSALHRVLAGDQMPTQTDVRAVILGCGGTDDDVSRYVSAWRKIRSPHRAPAPVALPGPRVVAVTAAKKAI